MNKNFLVFNSFSGTAFAGNPAGIVPDADDLDDKAMQNIARQLNLVETVFITKPDNQDASFQFRYFTPTKELPIAGHPTIAGWAALKHLGLASEGKYIQETGAGNISVVLKDDKIFASQKPATIKPVSGIGADDLGVFGLTEGDLDLTCPPAAVDTGLGHLIFAVKSLDQLMGIGFNPEELEKICRKYGVRECQIFCFETQNENMNAHTRNLCPRYGLEDPACGNGNAALGAYFSKFVYPDAPNLHLTFEQGHIVQMPSVIEVLVESSGIMIGGEAKLMVEGTIYL